MAPLTFTGRTAEPELNLTDASISELSCACEHLEQSIAHARHDVASLKATVILEESRNLHFASPTVHQASVAAKKDRRRISSQISKLQRPSVLTEELMASLQQERSSGLKAIEVLQETRAAVRELLR